MAWQQSQLLETCNLCGHHLQESENLSKKLWQRDNQRAALLPAAVNFLLSHFLYFYKFDILKTQNI